jgi:HD-GYP domain-containing protein (c-di-GMP phosphodiesterase class II)
VADAWETLRSDRPYRPAWSEARALAHLQAKAGQQFDHDVVQLLVDVVRQGRA